MGIWERIIAEVQASAGGFNVVGPGRFGGLPFDPQNFDSSEKGGEWPYEDDGMMNYGVPAGPRGLDRGTRPGTDVSGGPPTPSSTYDRTWQDMHEAMGSPSVTGPFVPMDGPTMRGGRDARPVMDVDGDPITEPQMQDKIDPKIGPNNMWGGAGTIPGQDRGFANSPAMGENDPEITKWKPPEERPMNLREFFDPETPPTEEVENPEQTHEKDQTDDEVENKLDRVYGQEDNHEFDAGKEPDDDSTEMTSGFDANGHMESPGDPNEEAEEAREQAAPGAIPPPSAGHAGIVMMDDEPAGVVDMGGEGAPEGPEAGPPKATVDAQDWQLTVEPEAGEMPTLSSMMGGGDEMKPLGDIGAMTQAAQGLLPKQDSSWDEMAIQVGDAVINLRKTGGMQPPPMGPPPGAPPAGKPPMMEKSRNRK